MGDEMMDVFNKAKQSPSFNYWIENLPEEDLKYLCNIMDETQNDTLEDTDTFQQIAATALHFSGKTEASEDEVGDLLTKISILFAMESNVREGNMVKTGIYSMIKNEESAKFSLTDKGKKSVEDMLGDSNATA
jgi:predicted transcriptional regulator